MNSGPNLLLSADSIAGHIRQRLQGEPAISLDSVLVPVSTGISGVFRSFAAYWLTMLLAGAFAYGAVLTAQGLAAQLLPRRLFLRFSGYLQMAAVGAIVIAYFVQPGFYSVNELVSATRWLPSYWFLALYQQLNGSMHPALLPLAKRAWIGLAAVLCVTPIVYALSYWRMLSAIADEPDITPAPPRWGFSGKGRLFGFRSSPRLAIAQFVVRTLARSRQHRLILSFYLGIGLAFTSLLLKGSQNVVNSPWRERSMVLWIASIMMMVLAVVGTRVAFASARRSAGELDLPRHWSSRRVRDFGRQPPGAASALRGTRVDGDRGCVHDAMAGAAERGTPDTSWMPWHDPGRRLPSVFSEDPLYMLLPARQIAVSHGVSRRPGGADGWLEGGNA